MPSVYDGCKIEPKQVPYWALFKIKEEVQEEVHRRAWNYLYKMGYRPYSKGDIQVVLDKRASVDIVNIRAYFRENYVDQQVDLEVPLEQFNLLSPAEQATS